MAHTQTLVPRALSTGLSHRRTPLPKTQLTQMALTLTRMISKALIRCSQKKRSKRTAPRSTQLEPQHLLPRKPQRTLTIVERSSSRREQQEVGLISSNRCDSNKSLSKFAPLSRPRNSSLRSTSQTCRRSCSKSSPCSFQIRQIRVGKKVTSSAAPWPCGALRSCRETT